MERRHVAYLIVALGILSGAAALGLLVELVEEIWFEPALGVFDGHVFHWLQNARSPLLDGLFMTITRLGNAPVLLAVAVAGGILMLLARRNFEVLVMTGCFAGTAMSVMALKWLLYRNRPAPDLPLVYENNPAFPSAHASLSLIVYVFAAYLIAQYLGTIRERLLAVGTGLGLALLIGLSRLYLGVHWLSDVLGGYALGGAWLALLLTIVELRRIEHPAPNLDTGQLTAVTWGLFLLVPVFILFLAFYALHWRAG